MGTMVSGMAFGAGSEVAHQAVRSVMGTSHSPQVSFFHFYSFLIIFIHFFIFMFSSNSNNQLKNSRKRRNRGVSMKEIASHNVYKELVTLEVANLTWTF